MSFAISLSPPSHLFLEEVSEGEIDAFGFRPRAILYDSPRYLMEFKISENFLIASVARTLFSMFSH
jgi:hypothetical protein